MNARKTMFETLVYGLGGIFTSIIGYILLPIYTKTLSVNVYGVNELLASISTIAIYILSMGVGSAVVKCYIRDCATDTERSELISTAILLTILVAGIVLIPLALFGRQISAVFIGDSNYSRAVAYALVWTFLMIVNALPLQVFRSERKPISYMTASLLQPLLSGILNIIFLVHYHMGVTGIYLGNALAALIIFLIYVPWILKQSGLKFSSRAMKLLLGFGLPLVPASLLIWVMNLSNRYFLLWMTDLKQVGLYALGYKVAMIIQVFLVAPFSLAWPPIMYGIAGQPNAKKSYADALVYYSLFGMFIVAGLVGLSPDLIRLMATSEYVGAVQVIPFTALAFFLYGANYALVVGVHLTNKNKYYPLGNLIGAVLNILLNLLLIPILGVKGSALGTFIAYLGLTGFTYWLSNRYYPIKYEWLRLLKIVGLGILAMELPQLITTKSTLLNIGLKSLTIIFVYGCGLYFLKLITNKEWFFIKEATEVGLNKAKAILNGGRS